MEQLKRNICLTILKKENCITNAYQQTVQIHNIKLCPLLNNPPHVLYSHFNLIAGKMQQDITLSQQTRQSKLTGFRSMLLDEFEKEWKQH